MAKLGLDPRCLWLGACAFSPVRYEGKDEGCEERTQGPFSVVSLWPWCVWSPGKRPSFLGLPQPQLGLSPQTVGVACHTEEVVTGVGAGVGRAPAHRGSGRGSGRVSRWGSWVLLASSWSSGGCGPAVPQHPKARGAPGCFLLPSPFSPPLLPPSPALTFLFTHSFPSSPFSLLSPLLHFFFSFFPHSLLILFSYTNRQYQSQNSGPETQEV